MGASIYAALPGTNDVFIDDGPKDRPVYGLCSGCHEVRLHSLAALNLGECTGNCRNGRMPHVGMCLRCGNEESARISIARREARVSRSSRLRKNNTSEDIEAVLLEHGGPMTPTQIAAALYGPAASRLQKSDYEALRKSTRIEYVRRRIEEDALSSSRVYQIIGATQPKKTPVDVQIDRAILWLKEHPGQHVLADVAQAAGEGRGGSSYMVKGAIIAHPNIRIEKIRVVVGGGQTRVMDHCQWVEEGAGDGRQGIQDSAEADTESNGEMEGCAESESVGHYAGVLSDAVDRGVRGIVLSRGGDPC